MPGVRRRGDGVKILALLVVALCACGGVVPVDVDAGDVIEAGGHELAARDAADALEAADVDACPPPGLSCSGERGGCAQGEQAAKRTECGGAPFAVCCPANICELAACARCTGCP